MHLKTLWSVTARAAEDWWNDNCIRLSASLAYYTALSLAPLVVIIVGLAGLVTGRQQVASQLEAQLELLMGQHGRLKLRFPRAGVIAVFVTQDVVVDADYRRVSPPAARDVYRPFI